MNAVMITKMKKWTEKLAEKDFQQFTPEEQKEMKQDYKLAEKQSVDYGKSAECNLVMDAFRKQVQDMEGFFYATEKA